MHAHNHAFRCLNSRALADARKVVDAKPRWAKAQALLVCGRFNSFMQEWCNARITLFSKCSHSKAQNSSMSKPNLDRVLPLRVSKADSGVKHSSPGRQYHSTPPTIFPCCSLRCFEAKVTRLPGKCYSRLFPSCCRALPCTWQILQQTVSLVLQGTALHLSEKYEDAQAAFKTGLEIDPENKACKVWMGLPWGSPDAIPSFLSCFLFM